jgi:hypothetical protein
MTEKPTTTQHQTETPRPALTFDAQEFTHFLDDCDWTDEQKLEFIQELWQIVVSFVDLGFDLHPVQQVIASPSMLEPDSGGMLESGHTQRNCETTHKGFNRLVEAGRPDS